jgi:hypothetical protein
MNHRWRLKLSFKGVARARPKGIVLEALGRVALVAILAGLAVATHAGPAGNLKRVTLAGGATNSTGTNYRLKGTVGQDVAGRTISANHIVKIGYWYLLGPGGTVGTEPTPRQTPLAFRLEQNAPNPFRGMTRVRFALPQERHVSLRIFDVGGRALATPIDQRLGAGEYTFALEPRELSSGVYFYEMRAGEFIQRKRFVLLK